MSLGIGGTTGEFYRALGEVLCTRHLGVDLEKFMKEGVRRMRGKCLKVEKEGELVEKKKK